MGQGQGRRGQAGGSDDGVTGGAGVEKRGCWDSRAGAKLKGQGVGGKRGPV